MERGMRKPTRVQMEILVAMKGGRRLLSVHGIRRNYWAWSGMFKNPHQGAVEAILRSKWIEPGDLHNHSCRIYVLTDAGRAALSKAQGS